MNGYRQIKCRLKEAGIYLKYLHEDIDVVESIHEGIAFRIDQLLEEATQRLREAGNLLNLETKADQASLQSKTY